MDQKDASNGAKRSRPKVLLVDDSVTVVEMLKHQLEKQGYDVVTHTKSLGTMVTILREMPDVIMLDITMPGLEGPQLCKLIKKDPSMSGAGKTPVLLYSSVSEEELKQTVASCGADGYLHKSWSISDIVSKISETLERKG